MRDLRFFSPQKEMEPASDGLVWAYYDVTDISSPTQILTNMYVANNPIIVDGVTVQRAASYQFSSTGIHLIKYSMDGSKSSFRGVTSVIEIYLPNTITSLYYQFILGASNLEKFVVPSSVTTINASGIGLSSTKIREAIFPGITSFNEAISGETTKLELASIVQIGPNSANRSFLKSAINLRTVILGPSCQRIGARTFESINWLSEVVIEADTPPEVITYGTYNMGSNVKFFVPYSANHSVLDSYKNASGFSTYSSQIYELNPDGSIPTS